MRLTDRKRAAILKEIMLKNEECEKVCGKQTDEECWYRFFVYKLKGG